MTNAEIEILFNNAQKLVRVSCDEYHAHSACRGCLSGDEQAVAVCKLAETIKHDREALGEVFKDWK